MFVGSGADFLRDEASPTHLVPTAMDEDRSAFSPARLARPSCLSHAQYCASIFATATETDTHLWPTWYTQAHVPTPDRPARFTPTIVDYHFGPAASHPAPRPVSLVPSGMYSTPVDSASYAKMWVDLYMSTMEELRRPPVAFLFLDV